METPKQPEILFSIALDKIKQHLIELKKVRKNLRSVRKRIDDLKRYIKDIDLEELTSNTKEKQKLFGNREALAQEIEEWKVEVDYLMEEEQKLIASIGHAGAEDQFMQDKMDNLSHGNV